MSTIYYINGLEFEVSPFPFPIIDSLACSLLDQMRLKNSNHSNTTLVTTLGATEILSIKSILKAHITQNLPQFEEKLLQDGSRFFGIPVTTTDLQDFLIPAILHEFLFGEYQCTSLFLQAFVQIYQFPIQVIVLICLNFLNLMSFSIDLLPFWWCDRDPVYFRYESLYSGAFTIVVYQ